MNKQPSGQEQAQNTGGQRPHDWKARARGAMRKRFLSVATLLAALAAATPPATAQLANLPQPAYAPRPETGTPDAKAPNTNQTNTNQPDSDTAEAKPEASNAKDANAKDVKDQHSQAPVTKPQPTKPPVTKTPVAQTSTAKPPVTKPKPQPAKAKATKAQPSPPPTSGTSASKATTATPQPSPAQSSPKHASKIQTAKAQAQTPKGTAPTPRATKPQGVKPSPPAPSAQPPSAPKNPTPNVKVRVIEPGSSSAAIVTDGQPGHLRGLGQTHWQGQVTEVSDGDSMIVIFEDTPRRISLSGIDAPERGQPFAPEATGFLKSLVLSKTVEVQLQGRSRDGESLAQVTVGTSDVAAWMVSEGYARWQREDAPHDTTLQEKEAAAKAAKRGLWGETEE